MTKNITNQLSKSSTLLPIVQPTPTKANQTGLTSLDRITQPNTEGKSAKSRVWAILKFPFVKLWQLVKRYLLCQHPEKKDTPPVQEEKPVKAKKEKTPAIADPKPYVLPPAPKSAPGPQLAPRARIHRTHRERCFALPSLPRLPSLRLPAITLPAITMPNLANAKIVQNIQEKATSYLDNARFSNVYNKGALAALHGHILPVDQMNRLAPQDLKAYKEGYFFILGTQSRGVTEETLDSTFAMNAENSFRNCITTAEDQCAFAAGVRLKDQGAIQFAVRKLRSGHIADRGQCIASFKDMVVTGVLSKDKNPANVLDILFAANHELEVAFNEATQLRGLQKDQYFSFFRRFAKSAALHAYKRIPQTYLNLMTSNEAARQGFIRGLADQHGVNLRSLLQHVEMPLQDQLIEAARSAPVEQPTFLDVAKNEFSMAFNGRYQHFYNMGADAATNVAIPSAADFSQCTQKDLLAFREGFLFVQGMIHGANCSKVDDLEKIAQKITQEVNERFPACRNLPAIAESTISAGISLTYYKAVECHQKQVRGRTIYQMKAGTPTDKTSWVTVFKQQVARGFLSKEQHNPLNVLGILLNSDPHLQSAYEEAAEFRSIKQPSQYAEFFSKFAKSKWFHEAKKIPHAYQSVIQTSPAACQGFIPSLAGLNLTDEALSTLLAGVEEPLKTALIHRVQDRQHSIPSYIETFLSSFTKYQQAFLRERIHYWNLLQLRPNTPLEAAAKTVAGDDYPNLLACAQFLQANPDFFNNRSALISFALRTQSLDLGDTRPSAAEGHYLGLHRTLQTQASSIYTAVKDIYSKLLESQFIFNQDGKLTPSDHSTPAEIERVCIEAAESIGKLGLPPAVDHASSCFARDFFFNNLGLIERMGQAQFAGANGQSTSSVPLPPPPTTPVAATPAAAPVSPAAAPASAPAVARPALTAEGVRKINVAFAKDLAKDQLRSEWATLKAELENKTIEEVAAAWLKKNERALHELENEDVQILLEDLRATEPTSSAPLPPPRVPAIPAAAAPVPAPTPKTTAEPTSSAPLPVAPEQPTGRAYLEHECKKLQDAQKRAERNERLGQAHLQELLKKKKRDAQVAARSNVANGTPPPLPNKADKKKLAELKKELLEERVKKARQLLETNRNTMKALRLLASAVPESPVNEVAETESQIPSIFVDTTESEDFQDAIWPPSTIPESPVSEVGEIPAEWQIASDFVDTRESEAFQDAILPPNITVEEDLEYIEDVARELEQVANSLEETTTTTTTTSTELLPLHCFMHVQRTTPLVFSWSFGKVVQDAIQPLQYAGQYLTITHNGRKHSLGVVQEDGKFYLTVGQYYVNPSYSLEPKVTCTVDRDTCSSVQVHDAAVYGSAQSIVPVVIERWGTLAEQCEKTSRQYFDEHLPANQHLPKTPVIEIRVGPPAPIVSEPEELSPSVEVVKRKMKFRRDKMPLEQTPVEKDVELTNALTHRLIEELQCATEDDEKRKNIAALLPKAVNIEDRTMRRVCIESIIRNMMTTPYLPDDLCRDLQPLERDEIWMLYRRVYLRQFNLDGASIAQMKENGRYQALYASGECLPLERQRAYRAGVLTAMLTGSCLDVASCHKAWPEITVSDDATITAANARAFIAEHPEWKKDVYPFAEKEGEKLANAAYNGVTFMHRDLYDFLTQKVPFDFASFDLEDVMQRLLNKNPDNQHIRYQLNQYIFLRDHHPELYDSCISLIAEGRSNKKGDDHAIIAAIAKKVEPWVKKHPEFSLTADAVAQSIWSQFPWRAARG